MQGEKECVASSSVHCCCQSKRRTNSSKRQVRRSLSPDTALSADQAHIINQTDLYCHLKGNVSTTEVLHTCLHKASLLR